MFWVGNRRFLVLKEILIVVGFVSLILNSFPAVIFVKKVPLLFRFAPVLSLSLLIIISRMLSHHFENAESSFSNCWVIIFRMLSHRFQNAESSFSNQKIVIFSLIKKIPANPSHTNSNSLTSNTRLSKKSLFFLTKSLLFQKNIAIAFICSEPKDHQETTLQNIHKVPNKYFF